MKKDVFYVKLIVGNVNPEFLKKTILTMLEHNGYTSEIVTHNISIKDGICRITDYPSTPDSFVNLTDMVTYNPKDCIIFTFLGYNVVLYKGTPFEINMIENTISIDKDRKFHISELTNKRKEQFKLFKLDTFNDAKALFNYINIKTCQGLFPIHDQFYGIGGVYSTQTSDFDITCSPKNSDFINRSIGRMYVTSASCAGVEAFEVILNSRDITTVFRKGDLIRVTRDGNISKLF